MKVRKLAVALALAGGLGSGVAQALGLGEIELQSFLNEPLDADIELRKSAGVSPGEVFVNIAPESAYERVGISRSYFLTKLNFQVSTAPDGNLVVNVSSREPLREPYLNFLVEVTWPNGRLMREYAVLIDPPVYAEESGVQDPVAAPTTTISQQPRQQTQQAAPDRVTRQISQTGVAAPRTLGPTNSADTLWTIAQQVRPNNSVSMQQVMLAIQDLNPNAFIRDNINRLKRGEILRIPDENQIRSRSRAEANQEVAIQNRAFSTPTRTVDATDAPANAADSFDVGRADGDQLRLIAADDTASRDAAEGGSAGGDGETSGGADAGSAVAMEELESARRENDELTGRVDDLQDQVQTLQRLLELKNTQLAEMQNAEVSPEEGDQAPLSESPSGEGEELSEADPAIDEATQNEQAPEEGEQLSEADPALEEAPGEQGDSAAESSMDETEALSEADPSFGNDAAAPSTDSVVEEAPEAEVAPIQASADAAPAEKSFPGNIIDAISNNPLYQIALGGGLVVLLLLLLLLARRNANREKAFYDQLNNDAEGDDTDSFDLTLDEDEAGDPADSDPVAEADAYIAYGRNDQAAHTLETAISREPSRTDLRLKLLGVYADSQDRDSFDKQFGEIEALEDDDALAEATSLRAHLEEAESMPSIDDLESQLRSDGGADKSEGLSYESDYMASDYEDEKSDFASETADSETSEGDVAEDDVLEDELDFEDLDLDLPEEDAAGVEEKPAQTSGETRDDLIEYDLSGLESDEVKAPESDELDDDFSYSLEEDDLETNVDSEIDDDDLSLDFETSDSDDKEKDATPLSAEKPLEESAVGDSAEQSGKIDSDLELEIDEELDTDSLDETFLDELDAELDKVADEEEPLDGEDASELDDLELDVSDEDLALMEEFSETDDAAPSESATSAEDEASLDDDLDLDLDEALSGEEPADPEQEVEGAEQAGEQLADGQASDESDDDNAGVPVASGRTDGGQSDQDLDEADLGDDDDFDFLAGTDEAATKLDLARAYVEMGDVDGARDILEEVALEGTEEQKSEAQDLLKNLS